MTSGKDKNAEAGNGGPETGPDEPEVEPKVVDTKDEPEEEVREEAKQTQWTKPQQRVSMNRLLSAITFSFKVV